MPGKRHTPEQILAKLRGADALLNGGATVAAVIQHLGVSEPTYHRWREQYGGMKAGEAKRLKELELENARLKRAVADLTLDACPERSRRKLILKESNDLLGKDSYEAGPVSMASSVDERRSSESVKVHTPIRGHASPRGACRGGLTDRHADGPF